MIPSDPEQIFKIAQSYYDQGDPDFAQNYLNESMDEYDRIYGNSNQNANLYNRISEKKEPENEQRLVSNNPSYSQPSIWDRLRGYGNQVNDHMREHGIGYAATAPFLAAGIGGLMYGLRDNKKRRR